MCPSRMNCAFEMGTWRAKGRQIGMYDCSELTSGNNYRPAESDGALRIVKPLHLGQEPAIAFCQRTDFYFD
jgi:hypothetical protein